jgi:hypothetical protein
LHQLEIGIGLAPALALQGDYVRQEFAIIRDVAYEFLRDLM